MSEVKPLNLSGGYNPLAEVDRESYADKVRKNSQTIMQQAMGKYQMQAAQQNMQNQKELIGILVKTILSLAPLLLVLKTLKVGLLILVTLETKLLLNINKK